MAVTCANAPIWDMIAELWECPWSPRGSDHTIEGYLRTARRWAGWLVDQGHDVAPDGTITYHVQAFIAGIIKKTSKGNAAHHYCNLWV